MDLRDTEMLGRGSALRVVKGQLEDTPISHGRSQHDPKSEAISPMRAASITHLHLGRPKLIIWQLSLPHHTTGSQTSVM